MLDYLLKSEKIQLPCWIPVLLSIGILLCMHNIIHASKFLIVISITLIILNLIYSNYILRILSIFIISVIVGIFAFDIRVKIVNAPIIPYDEKYCIVQGLIENITPLDSGFRIILSDVEIKNLKQEKTPKKIRLTVKTSLEGVKLGNIIEVRAILSKPQAPYLPDSYNFARDLYFKRIGAIGYTVSDFVVISEDSTSFISKINKVRYDIQQRVNLAIGKYYGSVATALMINEYSNINKQVLKNLRSTGLAHILSVSGMHLSLVAAIFFISTRFLLNSFPSIALKIHCKKVAAAISLIGSLGYLLISGMEVAAVRSFIMASMVIIAILIDRSSNPMRAIAWAAIIILLITPEYIVHPSFQMSFAAVLALIAGYELFMKLNFGFSEFNIVQKCLFYFLSLAFSSLMAGLATAPFALYHFSQTSNYSILANLLAVPITSFWLMPLVVITFLLYPLHMEILGLYPMKLGIYLLIEIANYISQLPKSVSYFMKMTDYNLLIMSLGFLWLCIWNTKIRFFGIIFIFLSLFLQSKIQRPDIFIDWEKKSVAIIDSNNDQVIFLQKPLVRFKKQTLLGYLGISKSIKYDGKNSKLFYCEQSTCTYKKSNNVVIINLDNLNIEIKKENKNNKYSKTRGVDLFHLN